VGRHFLGGGHCEDVSSYNTATAIPRWEMKRYQEHVKEGPGHARAVRGVELWSCGVVELWSPVQTLFHG
jgi:hypothetical protein